MKGLLVDSNIILDIFLDDPKWADWSEAALIGYSAHATLYINPIIYTEVSIGFKKIEDLESALHHHYPTFTLEHNPLFLTSS